MYSNKHFIVFLFTLSSWFAFAQQESILDRKDGGDLVPNAQLNIEDPKFNDLITTNTDKVSVFTSINPEVLIHFGFNDKKNTPGFSDNYKKVYSCVITLLITPYDIMGNEIASNTINKYPNPFNITLEIKHDNVNQDQEFEDYKVYKLPGIHKAKVQIISVTYSDPNILSTESAAYLSLEFKTDRYYNMQLNSTQFTSVKPINYQFIKYNGTQEVHVSNASDGAEEIMINWTKDLVAPAVEYELEWTWIDNYGKNGNQLSADKIGLTEQDFKTNSTRIQTKENSYRVPLVFSQGYLVYRIRPVGRFLDDVTKNYYGIWSSGLTDNFTNVSNWPHIEINQPHESGLKNWQYQSSFAEDGKKKEVVSYFDGSLRNRQTVTKINSNNKAVVGEVIYDNQGRAAIEVLPTPVESSGIHFYPDLNKNLGASNNPNTIYTHNDFDWEPATTSGCEPITPSGMAKDAGASKYYSDNNSVLNNYQDLVPDAKNYPFSQIEYTPDNTGRISRKGGVGPDHQIGSGHEMQYFYSQPSQEELNRLFGYKVGDVSRYKKNMVVDPNKQISVSYLDPQGRTIATALAGDKQGNLISLDDETGSTLLTTENRLFNNDKYTSGENGTFQDGIRLNTTITVSKEGPITFNYGMTKPNGSFNDDCLVNKYYPFVYKWSMSMQDNCANELLPSTTAQPLNDSIGTVSLEATSNLPQTIANKTFITESVKKGSYSLSKDIHIDRDALNQYADDYIATLKTSTNNDCKPNITQFTTDVSITGCNVTCKSCEEALVKANLSEVDFNQFKLKLGIEENQLGNINSRATEIEKARDAYALNNKGTIPDVSEEQEAKQLKFEFDKLLSSCRELCQQPINVCGINEQMLLDDMSPHGQYGSVEGLDILGVDPVVSDAETAEEIAQDTATTPIPTTDVPLDPLSIFNDDNQLYYGGYVPVTNSDPEPDEPAMIKKSNYSWRNPFNPNENEDVKKESYLDEYGALATIRVKLIGENQYTPALRTIEQTENIIDYNRIDDPASDDPNDFLVNPKYLDNVADFVNVWKPVWAKSLLTYHPEYQYYKYNLAICTLMNDGLNSDGFDDKLSTIEYYNSETNTIVETDSPIFATNGTGIIEKLINYTYGDPFFITNNTTPSIITADEITLRKALMTEALTTNYDGLTIANPQGGEPIKLNMLQAAYYFAVYANGITPFSTYETILNQNNSSLLASINSTTTPIDNNLKQKIWANFRSYYTSLKQKTRTVFSHIYALNNKRYNDCIGNDKSSDTFTTLFKKYAVQSQLTPIINNALSTPAGTDLDLICSSETASLYKDKEKRFVPADYGYDSSNDTQAMADIKAKADANLYLETGQCPLALELENFLKGLVDKTIQQNGLLINNFDTYKMPYLTKGIFNAQLLDPSFDINGEAYSPVIHATKETITTTPEKINLNINFYKKVATNNYTLISYPIHLEFESSFVNFQNPCGEVVPAPKWEDIISFNHFYFIPNSYNTQDKTYKFKIIGTIYRQGIPTTCTTPEEVIIIGTTKAAISGCHFPGTSDPTGVGETLSYDDTPCNKKELFSNSLKDLLLKLQTDNHLLDYFYDITNDSVFKNGYLYTYLGIKPTDTVVWRYTDDGSLSQRSFTISVNEEPRFKINAGRSYQDSEPWAPIPLGKIIDLFIGGLTSAGTSNEIKVKTEDVSDTGVITNKTWTISSGVITKPLYFSCCSSCGEWDFNGDGTGDICQNLGTKITCSENYIKEEIYETTLKNLINNFILSSNHEPTSDSNNGEFGKKGYVNDYQYLKDFVIQSNLIENFNGLRKSVSLPEQNFSINNMQYTIMSLTNRPDPKVFTIKLKYGQIGYGDYLNSNSIHLKGINLLNVQQINNIDIINDKVLKVNYTDSTTNDITEINVDFDNIAHGSTEENSGNTSPFCPFINNKLNDTTSNSNNSSDTISTFSTKPFTCSDICVPPVVEPVVCSEKWQEFKTGLTAQISDYTIPINLATNGKYFCEANFGYISSYYLEYLQKLNITSKDHPLFITIGEFGATKLRYGNKETTGVINNYTSYINSIIHNGCIPATCEETKTWTQFADDYVTSSGTCVPATMVPTFSLEVDTPTKSPCEIFLTSVRDINKQQIEDSFYATKKEEFIQNYLNQALNGLNETLTQTSNDKEYQYTLYYYDQAGNLIQTVPPEGVKRLPPSSDVTIDSVRKTKPDYDLQQENGVDVVPDHKLQTQYRYNSLNQLVWQRTPDGGETRFAYDALGRIIASQNDKQKPNGQYSYTRYDGLGRIFEAGQFTLKSGINPTINDIGRLEFSDGNPVPVNAVESTINYPYNIATESQQITKTLYDNFKYLDDPNNPDNPDNLSSKIKTEWFTKYGNDNSHKRVTAVLYYDTLNASSLISGYKNGIFYDYDVHGNVKELIHHINNNDKLTAFDQDRKKVVYDYDLISGNVNRVTYQPNNPKDQFIHRYEYDADNRIQQVYTSKDDVIWEKEANYLYYDHGPLARVELGDKKVQGLDYIYTLQGWLKGVNAEKIGAEYDAGGDGLNVAQDAFGFALNYYSGDYKSRFGTNDSSIFTFSKGANKEGDKNLYNGNIKEMVTSLLGTDQQPFSTQFNFYEYDQLNRIKQMNSIGLLGASTTFQDSYKSKYSYDKNGNLTHMENYAPKSKTEVATTLMDSLSYNYNIDSNGRLINNRLNSVNDSVVAGEFTNDSENLNDTSLDIDNQNNNNYHYDAIGQLTRDDKEGLTIDWRVDGKVKSVTKDNGTVISFEYDGLGNRISKTETTPSKITTTYYERDAQGNVLSVYELVKEGTNTKYYLVEQDIYGSSRLGLEKGNREFPIAESNVNSNRLKASTQRVATTQSTPAAIETTKPLWGLSFDSENANASWVDKDSKLNLFDNDFPKTESITINTHFKINPTVTDDGEKTLSFFQGGYTKGNIGNNNSYFFGSYVILTVTKNSDNTYTPSIKLLKYQRNYKKRNTKYKRTRAFTNYLYETSYIVPKGIALTECDFNAEIKLNKSSSKYDVLMTINGNVYKLQHDLSRDKTIVNGEGNGYKKLKDLEPIYLLNNRLGNPNLTLSSYISAYTNNFNKALKSQLCDFTYSIDNGENREDIKTHTFGFDEGGGTTATSVTTTPDSVNTNTTLTGLDMTLSGVIYTDTYCGNQFDTDGDGYKDYKKNENDAVDNCRTIFNPDQKDDDVDGVGNVCDNCEHPNPLQIDTDGDGKGDDVLINGEIIQCDNCKLIANFDQIDSDGDHVGDVCDNCKEIANIDQLDENHNGIGDVCEGLAQGQGKLAIAGEPSLASRTVGDKQYELSNHLGNVLSVISDRSIFKEDIGVGYHFLPDVLSYSDYYPFGMLVPNRHSSSTAYRFGFNGKENDDEVMGEGNFQDYGMRMYNPRIGRFFAVDPLTKSYPMLTSYQFASNSPIQAIDMDGLEAFVTIDNSFLGYGKLGDNGQTRIVTSYQIKDKMNIIQKSIPANSEITAQGRDGIHITPTGITKLTNDNLGRILAFGTQVISNNDHYIAPTTMTTGEESIGTEKNGWYGLLDFKFSAYDLLGIPAQNLLEINGTVYNANEAGNFLWGMVLAFNKIPIDPALAADIQTRWSQGRADEATEQKAINAGTSFGNNLNTETNASYEKYSGNFLQRHFSSNKAAKDVKDVAKGATGRSNQVGQDISRKKPRKASGN